MTATGTPKFTGLVVASIQVNFIQYNVTAKAAFVDVTNGETHGWTEGTGPVWSEATKQKILELRESMENDLAVVHFGDATRPNAPAVKSSPFPTDGGIGEHLGADVEQV